MLCIHLALLCVQENLNDRSLMSSFVFILENESGTFQPQTTLHINFAQRNNVVEQTGAQRTLITLTTP